MSQPAPAKPAQSKRAIFGSVFSQISEITNINNLRQIQAAYDPRQAPETLKLQLLIKAHKSLVGDAQGLARDSHMLSKQLYLWACDESDEALRDVGDRLAYMNYQLGDIQLQHAKTLEQARTDLKEIRNVENDLIKLRDREKTLQTQLNKLHQDPRPKPETSERISATTAELAGVAQKVQHSEALLPGHKRRLVKSSYRTQFAALREMGDKLMVISQFGDLLLDQLPEDAQRPYAAQDRTAQIKGAASHILTEYSGPVFSRPSSDLASFRIDSPSQIAGGSTSLKRTDTRLFGESHPHVLTDGPAEPHGAATAGPSSVHPARPSPSTSTGPAPLNHQPASVPAAQPPKLPSRPAPPMGPGSSSYGGSSSEKTQLGVVSPPPAALQHGLPTVAEVGAHVPTTTNGPAQGILQPHPHPHSHSQHAPPDPDELPACCTMYVFSGRRRTIVIFAAIG